MKALISRVQLFAMPWTVAHQAPLFMEFSRQEHWSGLSFCSPGDLPSPGYEPASPALQADSLPSEVNSHCKLLLLLQSHDNDDYAIKTRSQSYISGSKIKIAIFRNQK